MSRTQAGACARWAIGLAAPLGLAGWLAFSWGSAQAAAPAQPPLYRIEGISAAPQRSAIAATGAAIIEVGADFVTLEATAAELSALRSMGLAPQLAASDEVRVQAFPADDPLYHDFAELTAELKVAAFANPAIFSLRKLGESEQGRPIWLGKISDRPGADEDEPEVLFTHHQHAREHLTVEQALYTLRMLTREYGVNPRITELVNTREIWMIFDVNPDGGEFDIETDSYVSWRKNRQQLGGSPSIGTDLNRNWDFRFGCCRGSSAAPGSGTFRGPSGFSAPETDVIRRFVDSRVKRGVQQIKAHIDFHSFGELILWPYGYTEEDVPEDMTQDDHDAFVAIGTAMAQMNGYTPEQSSDLYITDGTVNDWMYGVHKIFSFTFELYPKSGRDGGFYPPDETIAAQTERNREALLYFLEQADCPYRAIRKEGELCRTR
jgi:carboxypeptidase T